MSWNAVREALRQAVVSPAGEAVTSLPEGAAAPGAVLLVGRGGEIQFHEAFGCRSLTPEVTACNPDTVYDIASLTKAIVSVTLVMQAVEQGKLDVDKKVSSIVQGFGTLGKERIRIRHLLAHCSGYAATKPYYQEIKQAEAAGRMGLMHTRAAIELIRHEVFRSALEHLPGRETIYSDLGFILLGAVLETIYGEVSLDKLAIERIFTPLKLSGLGFVDLGLLRSRGLEPNTEVIAPTAWCPWRKKMLWGEVHDDNAWAMGGVAPHAGLFSTAKDVHQFAARMLECYHGRDSFIDTRVVGDFWTREGSVAGSSWAFGWDTPSEKGSSAGKYISQSAVGHLGFTGCSLWIDPEHEVDVVLLTNRIHPNIDNQEIKKLRPKIHDLVFESLGIS